MSQTNFKCHLCLNDFEESETILTRCNHRYCLACLGEHVEKNLNCKIKCPLNKCDKNLSDFIIRKVLGDSLIAEYEKLCVDQCKLFHCCLLPECGLRVAYTNKNIQYNCSNCNLFNCIMCGAAHKNLSCNEYQLNTEFNNSTVCRNELARAMKLFDRKSAQSKRQSIAELMKIAIVPNMEIFTCEICMKIIPKGSGLQLKECFHLYCKDCLREHIKNSTEIPIICPNASCKSKLHDSEIQALLSKDEFEILTTKCIRIAMSSLKDGFYCKSPNCSNCVEIIDSRRNTWKCNLCNSVNCIKCKAIHEGKSCEEYLSTEESPLKDQIKDKKLMQCPKCKIIIQKTRGCNWIKCSSCNTELCWILQTYRWGPKGPGDTSGGCRCGVNRKMCHPECWGCIPDTANQNFIQRLRVFDWSFGIRSNNSPIRNPRNQANSLFSRFRENP